MTTIAGAGELKLLELIKPYIGRAAGGDDAALLDPVQGHLVVSTDMAVEGVHFDLSWMRAADAGWRALAFALGDLAAKGAYPLWALSSVAVPTTWELGVRTRSDLRFDLAAYARLTWVDPWRTGGRPDDPAFFELGMAFMFATPVSWAASIAS